MITKTPVSLLKLKKEVAAKYPTNKIPPYNKINPLKDLLSANPVEFNHIANHVDKFITNRPSLKKNKSLLNKISLEIPKMLAKEIVENLELYNVAEKLWSLFHSEEILSTLETPEDEQAAALLEKLLSDYIRITGSIFHDNITHKDIPLISENELKVKAIPSYRKHNNCVCHYMGSDVNTFINNNPILQKKKAVLIEICKEIPRMLEEEIIENLELYYAALDIQKLLNSEKFKWTLNTKEDVKAHFILQNKVQEYLKIASYKENVPPVHK